MSTVANSQGTSNVKAVVRVAAGNFLEMYDFMVFGYYAAAIGRTFFPKASELAQLMSAFATFGVGFLMRPLGALVLGAYVDKHGRRKGLILTLGLMSLGTLSTAVVPGYVVIGVAAAILVVAGRLLQGFSAGVELGGVSVYLSEMATPGHKGFYVAWQSASQQCAVVFAAMVGVVLNWSLSKAQMESFGWRIPLLVGCTIIPFLFLLRRSLKETDEFLARKSHPSTSEIMASLRSNWKVVVQGAMLVTLTTVSFYMITTYTPTFGRSVMHLSDRDSLIVTLCVGISNFIWLPLSGALSDRVGRRPILMVCAVLGILTAYPALAWAVSSPSFFRLLGVEMWLSLIYGGYNGAMIVYLTEIMPAEVRASGFSLAYSLATALFGGFTPYIATWLIGWTRNQAIPGAWLSLAAAASLASILISRPERKFL